tara:strand:- start:38572 stop:38778 length:207 start_codon:yes stop_codon:yes gene_type:complete
MDKKISKQEKVLTHLQVHGSITPLEALEKYGSFRLGALIFNLRKQGYDIETSIVPKKGYAKYTYNASK